MAGGGVALAQSGGLPGGELAGDPAGNGVAAGGEADTGVPEDEQCTEQIRTNPRWVCLTGATVDQQGQLVVEYEADFAGEEPDKSFGFHLHLYGGYGDGPPAETMGNQAADPGAWYIEDAQPAVIPADRVESVIGDAPKVCARIADGTHLLVTDPDGGYVTGNCTPIAR